MSVLSPLSLVRLLEQVTPDAIAVALDPADPRLADALRTAVASCALSPDDLLLQIHRSHTTELRAVPRPVPPMPALLSALDPTSMGIGEARHALLARALVPGVSVGDAPHAAASHPVCQAFVEASTLGPRSVADLVPFAASRDPAIQALPPEQQDSVCQGLLELASGGAAPPIRIEVDWTIPGADRLLRQITRDRRRAPTLARTPSASGAWAPAWSCRSCGLDGLGLLPTNDGQLPTATAVEAAHRMGDHRFTFVALDPELTAAGPPCPRCKDTNSLGPIGVSSHALAAWMAILGDHTPGVTHSTVDTRARPAYARFELRLAIRDALDSGPLSLDAVATRVSAAFAAASPQPASAWRFAVQSELTSGAHRGASLQRLGLVALSLEPELLTAAATHAGTSEAVIARAICALLDDGAVAHPALEAYLSADENTALLPDPIHDGGRPPTLRNPDEPWPTLDRVLHQQGGPDRTTIFAVLRELRVLETAPASDRPVLKPTAIQVTRQSDHLACGAHHRGIDVAPSLTALLSGTPCTTQGCHRTLAHRPRDYGPLARWMDHTVARGTPHPQAEPGWTLHTDGGSLSIRARPTSS